MGFRDPFHQQLKSSTTAAGTYLEPANNLSDVSSAPSAKNNLNIGSVETKTDSYVIVVSDLGKSIRMNSADAKTFTFPSVGASEDGVQIRLSKIGAGRVTLQMVDSDKIFDSAATGTMYCDEAIETYAMVLAEYCHATVTWNVIATGTWITT